jgi:hypothetical protein
MASISNDGGGLKRILIVCPDGQRRAIRLGRMSKKQARSVNVFVEDLCAATRGAKVIENASADWLADLDDTMHRRLAKVGLVKPRERINATLGKLLSAFFDTLAVKPHTATTYKQTRTSLEKHFGDPEPRGLRMAGEQPGGGAGSLPSSDRCALRPSHRRAAEATGRGGAESGAVRGGNGRERSGFNRGHKRRSPGFTGRYFGTPMLA